MMRVDFVLDEIGKLGGTLKFFPSDEGARIGIAEEIADMVENEDQLRWLVKKLPKVFTDWPGMLEVREAFCTKFKPLDGIEAAPRAESPAFAALCPGDEDLKAREVIPLARRIYGEVSRVSDDAEMQDIIARAVERHRARNPLRDVKPASQDEIERIKEIQRKNRKVEA